MNNSTWSVDSWSVLVTIFAVILLVYYWWKPWEKSPPGPWLVPFVGVIPGLVGDLKGAYVTKWAEQCQSRIIQIRFLGQKIVILCSYDLIKEMYMKRPELIDRMEVNNFNVVDPKHEGILFASGAVWRATRRITMKQMRDLGMNSAIAEEYIVQEAEYLVSKFEEFNGKAFDSEKHVSRAASNVMNNFLFCKRFEYGDEKYDRVLKAINLFLGASALPVGTYVLMFKLGRLIFRKQLQKMRAWWNTVGEFIEEQIEEHRRNYNGTVKDLVDAFLTDATEGQNDLLDTDKIRSTVFEMFNGGADTTTIQLQWLLLYMAAYPEVQQRVYDELRKANGSATPCLQNKSQTPYTEAVINEVMRLNILVDLGLPRTNRSQDFEIDGYKIPKGTPILANYWGVQFDPNIFKNPEKFDPNHFLTEKNELKNLERMVSFTVGRRGCAGELLGRMEIYLFFAMFVLRFKIVKPDGVELNLKRRDDSGMGESHKFEIQMIRRNP